MKRNHAATWPRLAGFAIIAVGLVSGCAQNREKEAASGAGDTPPTAPAAGPAPAPAVVAPAPVTEKQGDQTRTTLAYPTGQRESSVILLEKLAPAEVRVGQPYTYSINVTNITDQPVGGVTVVEALGGGFELESSVPEPTTTNTARLEWTLGTLVPEETRTIAVSVIPQQVGNVNACMTVTYVPALCSTVQVVAPALKLLKSGPAVAQICDKLVFKYVVANAGTGAAKDVTITEALPDGLTSADGKTTVVMVVGELPAGEQKDFEIEVRPSRPGTFTSRAWVDSDLGRAVSPPLTTLIGVPSLNVRISGPEWTYPDTPITYRVDVMNTGTAVARDPVILLETAGLAGDEARRELEDILPGEAASLNVTVDPRGVEPVTLAARAQALCATDAAPVRTTTRIKTVPALLLETVDAVDPVKIGEETAYNISVKNQGTAPATSVTLTGILPPELEFVEAVGSTEATASGQNVKFGTIESLPPGEVASWQLRVRAARAGDVRFRLEMNSDYLDSPVVEVEPTRLF